MRKLSQTEKQNLLDALHNKTMEYLQLYASGLITTTELTLEMKNIDSVYTERIESMSGLTCPNTGLRFS